MVLDFRWVGCNRNNYLCYEEKVRRKSKMALLVEFLKGLPFVLAAVVIVFLCIIPIAFLLVRYGAWWIDKIIRR